MKKKVDFSKEYKKYLKKTKLKSAYILFWQIFILVAFIALWELLARLNVIDTFIMSSPSRICATLQKLMISGEIWYHSWITLYEALIGFVIATSLGVIIAIILWCSSTLRRILEPYIIVLNSLPKVALGPLIIIWIGVGTKAIVFMAVLIMIVISIINMLSAFTSVDKNQILLLESMGANKFQILFKLVLPSSLESFVALLKINVGLTWVGTIMGEYLVSRAGLGYLIVNGSQVFKLDVVMTSTVVLCALASLMYLVIAIIEKIVKHHRSK